MRKCCANCSWSFGLEDEYQQDGYREDDPNMSHAGDCCLGEDHGPDFLCSSHEFPIQIKERFIPDRSLTDLLKDDTFTSQMAFERYITNVLKTKNRIPSLYGNLNGHFTFTNFSSIYQLFGPFSITNYVLERSKPDKVWFHKSRLASSEELLKIIDPLEIEAFMGFDSKALLGHCDYYDDVWNRESDAQDNSKILVFNENGENAVNFSALELYYLAKFLTPNCDIYLSHQKPILYGESEKGRAYILGIKEYY